MWSVGILLPDAILYVYTYVFPIPLQIEDVDLHQLTNLTPDLPHVVDYKW